MGSYYLIHTEFLFFQDGGVIGTKHIDVLNARGLCAAMCFVAVSGHLGAYVLQ